MSDLKSYFANAFETTLTADPGVSGTTVAIASSTGVPTNVPFYAVIDVDDDAKREYVRVTARSDLSLTVVRYLAGSAAASGLTHAIGAKFNVVPTAQAFEDLHDRIDADAATVATIASDLDTAEAALVTVGSDLDTAEAAITTLDGRLDTAEADITTLELASHDEDHASRHATAGADHLGGQIGGYIEFGGASEDTVDTGLSTSVYEDGASVTFTKPASWTSYKIMAWGEGVFRWITAGGTAEAACRVVIDGNAGTGVGPSGSSVYSTPAGPVPARHQRSGLTGNAVVTLQYKEGVSSTGVCEKIASIVNYIAVRES